MVLVFKVSNILVLVIQVLSLNSYSLTSQGLSSPNSPRLTYSLTRPIAPNSIL